MKIQLLETEELYKMMIHCKQKRGGGGGPLLKRAPIESRVILKTWNGVMQERCVHLICEIHHSRLFQYVLVLLYSYCISLPLSTELKFVWNSFCMLLTHS
jgi:hypothetical protein